jgi:hypothetical protein
MNAVTQQTSEPPAVTSDYAAPVAAASVPDDEAAFESRVPLASIGEHEHCFGFTGRRVAGNEEAKVRFFLSVPDQCLRFI